MMGALRGLATVLAVIEPIAPLNDEPRRKQLGSGGADRGRTHRTRAAKATACERLCAKLGARTLPLEGAIDR